MGAHRRKWGWWLVAALAVVLAASLLFKKCSPAPSEPSGPVTSEAADSAESVPVLRDTVYVQVDGEQVPVVRERPASGDRAGEASASAETVVTIPLKEINGLVRGKGGKDVSLTTQAPDRISVSYSGQVDVPVLGAQNMDLEADFKIVEVQGDRLVLQLDSGAAMNLVADLFSSAILERLPKGLVESFSGGRAVVNLSAVPQLRQRLKDVDLTGFAVDEEGIQLKVVEK